MILTTVPLYSSFPTKNRALFFAQELNKVIKKQWVKVYLQEKATDLKKFILNVYTVVLNSCRVTFIVW